MFRLPLALYYWTDTELSRYPYLWYRSLGNSNIEKSVLYYNFYEKNPLFEKTMGTLLHLSQSPYKFLKSVFRSELLVTDEKYWTYVNKKLLKRGSHLFHFKHIHYRLFRIYFAGIRISFEYICLFGIRLNTFLASTRYSKFWMPFWIPVFEYPLLYSDLCIRIPFSSTVRLLFMNTALRFTQVISVFKHVRGSSDEQKQNS